MSDPHECPTCGRDGFASEYGLKQHHSKSHGEPLVGEICGNCGKKFRVSPSEEGKNREYCSKGCRYEAIRSTIECEICGDDFPVPQSRQETARFCSPDCKYEGHSDDQSGSGNGNYKGGLVTLSCEVCDSDFDVKPGSVEVRRFCSPECEHDWLRDGGALAGEAHPNWDSVEVACTICGGTRMLNRSRFDRFDEHVCSTECRAEWASRRYSGEGNPNYTGGVFPYGPGWNEAKKEVVRERDGRECQECGRTEAEHQELFGARHSVHHVRKARHFDTPEQRNHPDNLVTLCRGSCHAKWEQMAPLRPDTPAATDD